MVAACLPQWVFSQDWLKKIKETWKYEVKTCHYIPSFSQDEPFLYQSFVPPFYPALIYKSAAPVSLLDTKDNYVSKHKVSEKFLCVC